MRSFDEICESYGCDKKPSGYGQWYDKLVFPYVHRSAEARILEIGVLPQGVSMKLWQDLYPKGYIVGVDIDPRCADLKLDRVSIEIGDQRDSRFLEEVGQRHGMFDLIVDDGSHSFMDMHISFVSLWDYLKLGGVYVIEDVWWEFLDKVQRWPLAFGAVADIRPSNFENRSIVFCRKMLS